MKKTFKKLMAALLAVALLCAMAVPAFAADESTTETGTVTVQNVVSGKTYKIYRILDIDTHDSTYNSVVYKVNAKWKDFIESTGNTYFTRIDSTTGVVVVNKGLTSENIAALAAAAKAWLGTHTIAADGEQTAGATDTSIQFTGKELGYYLLSSSSWGENNADAIFSLSSSNPNVTVQEKNGKPTIDKKIVENSNTVENNTAGLRVAVTAGPTQEALDPVRYLTNHSTGKMGYALARAAAMRGADVTLIHGETALQPVRFTEDVPITTAQQMYEAVTRRFEDTDVLIMAAAVADYRPAAVANDKIKKKDGDMSIPLERTPDILGTIGPRKAHQFLCGFSMETRDLVENSSAKLTRKNLDMVVANNLKVAGAGFGVDTNVVTLITPDGARELPLMSKADVADAILDEILKRKNS